MKTLSTAAIFAGTLVELFFIGVYVLIAGTGGSLVELWQNIRRGPPEPP